MISTETALQLNTFIYEEYKKGNLIESVEFDTFIGHSKNKEVYGALFNTSKGFLFVQHKWVKTNTKTVPSVYAVEKSVFKFVDNSIYNSFEKISLEEHSDRWGNCLEKI